MSATRIAVFVFEGAEELDFVGPWEVLTMWAKSHPDDGVEVFMVAQGAEPVTCAKGMRVIPDHTWDTAPSFDVLVFPGGEGNMPQIGNEAIRSWLQKAAQRGTLMTSVCSGSLVYADAGLLDGKPATSHWSVVKALGSMGKDIEVRPDDRFVDAGNVITAAGVSAGIDMALHLVARLKSPERAREVKRNIQYDPQPPV
jgi:transcriptional regulator GlxA family with amidase domain